MKMKRIDFMYGVIYLTAFLLLPIFLHIYGYLDQRTYVKVIHQNSFYENSSEIILMYSHFKGFLLAISITLITTCICLTLVSFTNQTARYQIKYYRPYFTRHCIICVIPFVIRYINLTDTTSDDIMIEMDWERLFLVISSIFRFILSLFLCIVQKYKFWRLVLYVLITVIHSFVITYLFCLLLSNCVELFNIIKKSKDEFLTQWSYVDHEQPNDLNVSKINTYLKDFSLDQNLFLATGQKSYQTQNLLSLQIENIGEMTRPYQQGVYQVGIGESVSLPCNVGYEIKEPVSVLWSLNRSYSDFNLSVSTERSVSSNIITTELNIDLENSGFGDITCSLRHYRHFGEQLFFQNKMATSSIQSEEAVIAQYSVRKYSGRDFYIYATAGGAIDITWKPMSFNNDLEDLIQYYYVNGVLFNRPKNAKLYCSSFSYLYILYGLAMNWFDVNYAWESSHFLKKHSSLFETHFTECAGPSVFGIHTVEYLRPVYDKKSGSYVLREVQHPDTLYVRPDLAYFHKMDNATKEKKIKDIQKFDLDYPWFDNSDDVCLIARVFWELITVLFLLLLCCFFLYKWLKWYSYNIIQPIKNFVLGQPFYISSKCSVLRGGPLVCCYVLCGDADRNSVYNELVVPLRNNDVTTGFTFEESHINKSGKSVFDIQCDILKQCKHLIFYVTSSYLKEENFVDIQLETVLQCIKMGFISSNRVLIIIADNCELPDKIIYNLPEAVANIHDWVTVTKPDHRISRITKWMKDERKDI
ncbi:uncharacterized protein LOC128167432 [Crassostrea angulata]|uniref:uncharacterized protein LOC128167432 n=1 Tax=Magallana angulata TaxID=2784310 RepID=UPI0022B0ED9B|nr:uncharacterized protein LOC128167432 [Crassostrea angulata]